MNQSNYSLSLADYDDHFDRQGHVLEMEGCTDEPPLHNPPELERE